MNAPRRLGPAVLAGLFAAAAAPAADVPGAVVFLEVLVPPLPGYVAQGAPARFALMEDGTFYVGGTRDVMAGRLADGERKRLEKQIGDVRKLPGLGGLVTLGPGDARRHLVLRRGRPLEMVITGDVARAQPRWRTLAAFLADLEDFQHPSLRPYAPTSYALSAREGTALGGCRPWTLPDPLLQSVFAPRVVPAQGLGDWPTGANPATVCLEGKTYLATFRPLLPGEQP
jgi:hypothetical protein